MKKTKLNSKSEKVPTRSRRCNFFSLSDKTLSKQQEVTSASKMTSRLKEHLQERKQVYSWNFFLFVGLSPFIKFKQKNYKLPVVFMFLFGFIFINYIFFCSAVIHWSFSKNLTLLESVSLKQEKIIPKKVHHIYWKTREGFFIFKTKNSGSSYHVFVLFCRSEIETAVTKEAFFCKLTSETFEAKVFDCLSVAVRLRCFCFAKRKKV